MRIESRNDLGGTTLNVSSLIDVLSSLVLRLLQSIPTSASVEVTSDENMRTELFAIFFFSLKATPYSLLLEHYGVS